MQKIVREYSKTAWTDKDMIEFANKIAEETELASRHERDYEFIPCTNDDLESFKSEPKGSTEFLFMNLKHTDTICIREGEGEYIVSYLANKGVVISRESTNITERYGAVRNHAIAIIDQIDGYCWRAKSHEEAMAWLMKKE